MNYCLKTECTQMEIAATEHSFTTSVIANTSYAPTDSVIIIIISECTTVVATKTVSSCTIYGNESH